MTVEFKQPLSRKIVWKVLLEVFTLFLLSLLCAAKIVIGVYAWWGDPARIGLQVDLGTALYPQPTDVSFRRWANGIWLIIFAWEGIWIAYAWTFACGRRETIIRSIFPGTYPLYSLLCAVNIGWVFAWGNRLPQLSLALSAALFLGLYVLLGMVVVYLHMKAVDLKLSNRRGVMDLWITRTLVVNGIALYACWITITMLYDLGAVLQEYSDVHPATVSTIILSLMTSFVLSYFLLEVTILDRFLRYVLSVYPVVIWTLVAVLVRHWEEGLEGRNIIFSLVLVCVVAALFAARIIMVFVFSILRPIPDYESDGFEFLPH